tara:strand:+ start:1094 stop:1252 length:159 start_codon:yes stop_codon:yes gene_type:complete
MPGKHKGRRKDKAAEMINKMKAQQQTQAFDRKKKTATSKKSKSVYSRGKAKY